ncbi:MAG: 23S rRNA (pseudouridine(1915)-N(3))-methyltransferase RlmH [Eubacterium sp.]|nr:23S rRNA (pseudouridine(1915)-N(3))-methyltransferase RlmH [Eubacterium sp.]
MKIDICCVGKVKESYFRDAIKEYAKRLSRYTSLQVLEVADEKTPDGASEATEMQIKEKEGARILAKLKEDAYVIALAIDGKKKTSEKLAGDLERLTVQGHSHIQFVIGGSLGLSEAVLKRADEHLSFSDMTFPHQMMRVILLEQIYRSFRIIHHEPYHK